MGSIVAVVLGLMLTVATGLGLASALTDHTSRTIPTPHVTLYGQR